MHLEPDRLLVAHPRSLLRQLVDVDAVLGWQAGQPFS